MLVLIGDNSSAYARAVHEVVGRLGLGDRIRIEPVVEDPYPWYLAADVFVIASDIESMPRTLLEAMGFGVPVVAAAAWGVPELVLDGDNGLLFGSRDVGEIVAGLTRVLSLVPEERARLGSAAARTVAERHDVSGYVDAIGRLLHCLAADPGALPGPALIARTD